MTLRVRVGFGRAAMLVGLRFKLALAGVLSDINDPWSAGCEVRWRELAGRFEVKGEFDAEVFFDVILWA